MFWRGSALSLLVGIVGGVLLVCAVVLARRWPRRRFAATAGAGLLLLGLSLSGVIEVLARALAILSFNPLRWIGVAAAVVGVLLLSASIALPRQGRKMAQVEPGKPAARRETAAEPADGDLAEIEDILRRRGIQ